MLGFNLIMIPVYIVYPIISSGSVGACLRHSPEPAHLFRHKRKSAYRQDRFPFAMNFVPGQPSPFNSTLFLSSSDRARRSDHTRLDRKRNPQAGLKKLGPEGCVKTVSKGVLFHRPGIIRRPPTVTNGLNRRETGILIRGGEITSGTYLVPLAPVSLRQTEKDGRRP